MDVGWIVGICALASMALVVIMQTRKMKSPRLSLLEPLPDEHDAFNDAETRYTLLPYSHGAIVTRSWRPARVRATNRRLIISWRPPLWKEDCIAALIYYGPPAPSTDPFAQQYPVFTLDPAKSEISPAENGRHVVHIVPLENATWLPLWLEIETPTPPPYERLLKP